MTMTHDTTLLIQYIIHRYYSFVIVGVGLAYIRVLTLHVNFYSLTGH